jgi:hypothetical protein
MAGHSGYVIELSAEKRAELQRRVACYMLPHKVVVRGMILYAAEGQSTAEIARRLGDGAESGRPLAEALLRGAAGRARGARARGPPAPFFPAARSRGDGARLRAAGDAGTAALPAASRALSCTDWWSSAA